MTIVNRRNAVVGWTVWKAAKFVGKRKARQAVPGSGDYAGLNKSALATIAAAAASIALVVWRKKSAEPASG
jgi:ABC-type Co2+ transport system permease subunit